MQEVKTQHSALRDSLDNHKVENIGSSGICITNPTRIASISHSQQIVHILELCCAAEVIISR